MFSVAVCAKYNKIQLLVLRAYLGYLLHGRVRRYCRTKKLQACCRSFKDCRPLIFYFDAQLFPLHLFIWISIGAAPIRERASRVETAKCNDAQDKQASTKKKISFRFELWNFQLVFLLLLVLTFYHLKTCFNSSLQVGAKTKRFFFLLRRWSCGEIS